MMFDRIYYTVLLILFCCITFFYTGNYKKQYSKDVIAFKEFVNEYREITGKQIVDVIKNNERLDREVKFYANEIRDLTRNSLNSYNFEKTAASKLFLLCLVISENFAAIEAGRPDDIIRISSRLDYLKISRLPKYLTLTKSQESWLKQFVESQ